MDKMRNNLDEGDEMDVKGILHKNFPSAICQHCGKVMNIQFSSDFRKLIARNRTLSELNKTLREDWHKWMNIKNGQIEAMHKMAAHLVELIPEEHRKKTKEITHEMRDEIKHVEKHFMGAKGKVYKSQNANSISMLPGDLKRSPDESFSENIKIKLRDTLVFIDEAFLSKLSKHFGNGKYTKFDKKIFAINLAGKEKLFCKNVCYYLAPPFQSEPPTKEEELKKEGHDKFVKKLRDGGIILREGRCQRLKCDNNFVYKQKAVDVLLTMDLTNVPIKYPQIKNIILISSDSDFVPIVENLEENGIKTILYTYYEKIRDTPFSRSNHLIKSVYKYVLLTKKDFDDAPLKKEVKYEKE